MKFEELNVGDRIICPQGNAMLNIPHNGEFTVVLLHYSSDKDSRLIGVEAALDGSTQSTMIPTAFQGYFAQLDIKKPAQNRLSLQSLVDDCKFKDWNIVLRFDHDRPYVQIQFKGTDNFGSEEEMQYGRKWMLSYHMCDTEVVRTVKKAIDAAMQHEVDENFKYMGRTIFNPHRSIVALWQAAGAENGVDLRT